ncbi:MAG: hypothetical protein Q7S81_00280, partial [bacterium]|nr:hypothetical protein [bacterium]
SEINIKSIIDIVKNAMIDSAIGNSVIMVCDIKLNETTINETMILAKKTPNVCFNVCDVLLGFAAIASLAQYLKGFIFPPFVSP